MGNEKPKSIFQTEDDSIFATDSMTQETSLETFDTNKNNFSATNLLDEENLLKTDLVTGEDILVTQAISDYYQNSLGDETYHLAGGLDNFLSGDDIFGPEMQRLDIDSESLWFTALSDNLFFDTDLVYSSHEVIHLKEQNLFYDSSPHDSLIFVGEGSSDLRIADKQADIFIELGTETAIKGENSSINLFTTLDETSVLTLEGEFSNLSLNIYSDQEIAIDDIRIIDDQLLFGIENSPSVDLSNISYSAETIEIKSYSDAGLVDSQTINYSSHNNDPSALTDLSGDMLRSAPDAALESDITDFLHDDDILFDIQKERLFQKDVEVINLHSDASILDITDVANELMDRETNNDDFNLNIEKEVGTLISEPETLLEAGQLFADPLDIFDDTDFS